MPPRSEVQLSRPGRRYLRASFVLARRPDKILLPKHHSAAYTWKGVVFWYQNVARSIAAAPTGSRLRPHCRPPETLNNEDR